MQIPIYRIVDWNKDYENNRTRAMKSLSWIPQRVSFNGDRVRALIRRGSSAAYGCFRAIVSAAAACEPRGTLVSGMGTPHTPQTLADKTGLPAEDFAFTLDLCVKLNLIEISGHVEDDSANHVTQASLQWQSGVTTTSLQRHSDVTTTSLGRHYNVTRTSPNNCGFSEVLPTTEVTEERHPSVTRASPERHSGDVVAPSTERKKEEKEQQQQQKPTSAEGEDAAAAVFQKENREGPMLSEVVHELRACGVDANTISKLTGQYGLPQIVAAIKMVRARGDTVRNVAGLVISALKGDYDTTPQQSEFEANKKAEDEARETRKTQDREEEKRRVATHQKHLEILASLPPDEHERYKDAAYKALPKGVASKIANPDEEDPLTHGVWRSFMWLEFCKAQKSSESGELLAGTQ